MKKSARKGNTFPDSRLKRRSRCKENLSIQGPLASSTKNRVNICCHWPACPCSPRRVRLSHEEQVQWSLEPFPDKKRWIEKWFVNFAVDNWKRAHLFIGRHNFKQLIQDHKQQLFQQKWGLCIKQPIDIGSNSWCIIVCLQGKHSQWHHAHPLSKLHLRK